MHALHASKLVSMQAGGDYGEVNPTAGLQMLQSKMSALKLAAGKQVHGCMKHDVLDSPL